MSFDRESRTSWLIVAIGLALLALSIWQVGRVRPPGTFRIATGPEGSQSYRMAEAFVQPVAERGFNLEIVPMRGSGQVAEAMQQGGAEAGFLENTFSLQNDLTGIQALTAVYPEPLWIFYPADADADESYDALSDLSGRISIGEVNSGTNEIARLLFQLSEVGADQVSFVSLPDDVAADQLLSGGLDAVIIAGGINSDPVLRLLTSPDIEILNLRRIDALTILAPFLDSVIVPAGIVRLSQDRPSEDKNLLSTQAVLVTREDLHPDLQRLLLTVAELEHQPHRWFEADGQYPTTDKILLDLSPVTIEFYQGAPTYLERYLPFWIASPLERFYLLILPLLVLLYPLVRSSPSLYSGVMRRRINRWYKIVRDVELGLEDYSLEQVDEQITRLTQMNAQLARTINVPTGYMERYYNLRLHIRLVLDELRDRRRELLDEVQNEA